MKKIYYALMTLVLSFLISFTLPASITLAEENWPEPPEVSAASAIVIEADSGAVLYEKNSHEQHYPASITKIMTTLLALENRPLSDIVHFSKDSVYNVEGTQVGITPEEDVPLDECLYGIMLASGNEIAYAVAEHVGGDLNNFVNMMNQRAVELGCTNTHFNNPHGLPDENHFTCAYDMALIAREAYSLETFRTIAGTKYHVIPPTNLYMEERAMANHHKMLTKSIYHYDYCTGGKTGYTNVARYNLVTFAEKDGIKLICVIMKDEEIAAQYYDTTNLFDYCFNNFYKVNINNTELASSLDSSGLFPIENTLFSPDNATVSFEEKASVIIPNTLDISALSHFVSYEGTDETATINYTYGEHLLGAVPINYEKSTVATATTTEVVENNNFYRINVRVILYVIITIIVIALIILIILRFILNHSYAQPMRFEKRPDSSFKTRKKKR